MMDHFRGDSSSTRTAAFHLCDSIAPIELNFVGRPRRFELSLCGKDGGVGQELQVRVPFPAPTQCVGQSVCPDSKKNADIVCIIWKGSHKVHLDACLVATCLAGAGLAARPVEELENVVHISAGSTVLERSGYHNRWPSYRWFFLTPIFLANVTSPYMPVVSYVHNAYQPDLHDK